MHLEIDNFTEDELRDLHNRITERLRLIAQMRAHGTMLNFSIGDRVVFRADGRRIAGTLVRYNRKTVTVIEDGGHRWNVSPGLLERDEPASPKWVTTAPIVMANVSRAALNLVARSGEDRGS